MTVEEPEDAGIRPRLALRVGVSGHRELAPSRLEDLESRARLVLEKIRDAVDRIAKDGAAGYSTETPALRVISPIAEGADRLVARVGLELHYELQCPLPFAREEYATDFSTDTSTKEFTELLARASAVFELDGERSNESMAYQSVGRVVLGQCDVLIAIWDGRPAEGVGGTGQIVAEAERQEIPIIWLKPDDPGRVRLRLCHGDQVACIVDHDRWGDALEETLNRLLRPPTSARDGGDHGREESSLEDFTRCLARRWPDSTTLGVIWKLFVESLARPDPTAEHASGPPDGPFEQPYERANRAAIYFADLYRGSFVCNSFLGAVAVLLALMVVVVPQWHALWLGAELATIVTIVALIFAANRRRWHQKFLDCRLYAEQLRQMRYLWALGRVTPSSRPPAHHAFGDPRATVMNWRFRAVLRAVGMKSTRVTRDSLAESWRLACEDWIGGPRGQVGYHERTVLRYSRIDHRLHVVSRSMFVLTAAACLGHLWIHDGVAAGALTILAAALPAAAAAAHAISSQGEFRRLAERSRSMKSGLVQTERTLRALGADGRSFTSSELVQALTPAAAAMVDEVTDWRILYFKPPIEPA